MSFIRKIILTGFILTLFFPSLIFASTQTPEDLIEIFYSSRKFMRSTVIELLGQSQLSNTGKKSTDEVLYDYSVIEITSTSSSVSYAEVAVKKRSITTGIYSQKEYWKMVRDDGRWMIKNIYTPTESQTKNIFRPGSSLPEKVEALASYQFEYEVEDVPPGTPIQKAFAYIARRDLVKAFMWANISANQKHDAESFFVRGLLEYSLGRGKEGEKDIITAISMDRRYYYVLQNIINQSSGGGSTTGPVQSPSTRTMKGGIQSMFQK
jgi:hypothetical protein